MEAVTRQSSAAALSPEVTSIATTRSRIAAFFGCLLCPGQD